MADVDKLSVGLDEIIQLDRSTNRRGGNRRFRGRGGGFRNNVGRMPRTLNSSSSAGIGRWQHDLYEDNGNRGVQRNTNVNSTTKLLVSNLDFGVTTNDIEELFGDLGALRTARVHYDESGRSLGTAEVIYERRADAIAAQRKYNSVNLDGRPMDVRIIGGVDDGATVPSNRLSLANEGARRNQRAANRNNNQRNGIRGNRRRGGKQQNSTDEAKEDVTAEDLDAELDAYRAEGKQKK